MSTIVNMANECNSDDADHREFGQYASTIIEIKNNLPSCTKICFDGEFHHFSQRGWETLGKYVSKSKYVDVVEGYFFNASMMTDFVRGLGTGGSVTTLNVLDSRWDVEVIRSMRSFLGAQHTLTDIKFDSSHDINAENFEILVKAMHAGSGSIIRVLSFTCCHIDDISVLKNYSLQNLCDLNLDCNMITDISALRSYTNLERLCLENNQIGTDGCMVVASLLREAPLNELNLRKTDLGDSDAELLADALKDNTTPGLDINLERNQFTEKGFVAFLKLLNDVESIEATYKSNHTIISILLTEPTDRRMKAIKGCIDASADANGKFSSLSPPGHEKDFVGTMKARSTQLNSEVRMELSDLQGVDYSYESLFAQFDPILLPAVLALTADNEGQSELYKMLTATAVDLVSLVNRRAALVEWIAERRARVAALEAGIDEMETEVQCIDNKKNDISDNNVSGRKRDRSDL